MLQETGHLLPTFKLLRELAARGHRVRYLAIPDLRERVERQGFAVEPWFPDVFPAGYAEQERGLGRIAQRRAITSRFERVARELESGRGSVAPLLRDRPDVLLVDVNEPRMALFAERHDIPYVLVNTSLPQT